MLEAYTTHDISGFTYPNLSPELYIRWVQFGCFSPIMRFHSIYGLRMPWEYGDIGYDQVKKLFKLRYALLALHLHVRESCSRYRAAAGARHVS